MNMKLLSTWIKSNKLSLNVDKIKWLLFHPLSKSQLLQQTLRDLLIENINVKREYITKFLGVFIDENMSWKQHINKIRSKIFKSIAIFYKSRDVLSKCLKQLYFFAYSKFCNSVNNAWASTSKSEFERLYPCRVIYHKYWYTLASPLLNDMKALNFFQLNILNILCLCINVSKIELFRYFALFLPIEQILNMHFEIKILFKNLYAE